MGEKTLMRPILITAGIIGIVQGLIWMSLSLVSVLYYNKVFKGDKNYFGSKISDTIYFVYLDPDDGLDGETWNLNVKISSKNFNFFMYFYFGLSVVWFANSAIVLWANLRTKLKYYTIQLLILWIVCVCCLSIVDAVLMGLIAYDYNTVSNLAIDEEQELEQPIKSIILTAVGIVMTLAARGYVIWLINVIFAIILAKYCHRLLTKDPGPEPSIIDAFGNSTRPPWELQGSLYDDGNAANFEFTNKGFKNDNDEPIYTRSDSFHHLQVDPRDPRLDQRRSPDSDRRVGRGPERQEPMSPINNNNYSNSNINNFRNSPLNRFAPDSNQPPMEWRASHIKTAKIGRQPGQASPPLHVAPPFIPPPDYDLPRVKGVLRPKSNYMYE